MYKRQGELVGRRGREATDHHLKTVREFKIVEDVPSLRRFLGSFGWIRAHFPSEVVRFLPTLTAQLKKGAVWPLPPEAVKAQRAIQKLAEKAIRLAVFDEIAAITRTRPLEQIADCSGYGWGGTCYQLGPDRTLLNVIGMYNGLMTLAQSGYHPRRGECLAQM